jgi:hypothetical protein
LQKFQKQELSECKYIVMMILTSFTRDVYVCVVIISMMADDIDGVVMELGI